MKLALALVIALSTSFAASSAHAGSMRTVCSNLSGSIKIDDYKLTLKKAGKKNVELDLLSDAEYLNTGDVMKFGMFTDEKKVVLEFKVVKAGETKMVHEDGGEACSDAQGGMTAHAPGSYDETQNVRISFRDGGREKLETLTCNTRTGYSGHCVYLEDLVGN